MTRRQLIANLAIATAWAGFVLMVIVTVTPTDVALRCLGH